MRRRNSAAWRGLTPRPRSIRAGPLARNISMVATWPPRRVLGRARLSSSVSRQPSAARRTPTSNCFSTACITVRPRPRHSTSCPRPARTDETLAEVLRPSHRGSRPHASRGDFFLLPVRKAPLHQTNPNPGGSFFRGSLFSRNTLYHHPHEKTFPLHPVRPRWSGRAPLARTGLCPCRAGRPQIAASHDAHGAHGRLHHHTTADPVSRAGVSPPHRSHRERRCGIDECRQAVSQIG